MVRICFIAFLALTTSINVFAGKRAPKRLIRMGERLLDQSHDDSIYILGKYFVEKYPEDPKTKWVVTAAASMAVANNKDHEWAEHALKLILSTPDPPVDDDMWWVKDWSPHKSKACANLASLYLNTKRYKEALGYLNLSETQYPEHHLCAIGAHLQEGERKINFATCYEKLGYTDSAISVLLPYMFNYGLFAYDEAEEELLKLLTASYTHDYIATELLKARSTISVVADDTVGHIPQITAFGKTIEMSRAFHADITDPATNKDLPVAKLKEVYQNLFTASRFYKMFVQ